MGWNVSHGSNQFGEERCSALTISNLARQLAHVLTSAEWAELEPVFGEKSGDPFDVPPRQAARCAELLGKAAGHRKMGRGWRGEARLFAAAAQRASNAGEMWKWS